MTNRILTRIHLSWLCALAACAALPAGAANLAVGDLRCEYQQNPLGIDAVQPRLSWVLTAEKHAARGQAQSAYRVLVARNLNELEADQGDLWDSGKVQSDQSVQVRYAGKPLVSEQQCFWKVRVWDLEGKASAWSKPASWSMGLLNPSDWRGQWIGLDENAAAHASNKVLDGAHWIWFPGGQPEKAAANGPSYFRGDVTIPADRVVKQATLWFTADDNGQCFINGHKVGQSADFHTAAQFDVTRLLKSGRNVVGMAVENGGTDPNPAGLIALLRVDFATGEPLIVSTDSSWKSARKESAGWKNAGFDDSTWQAALVLGNPGMAPWGEITGPEDRRLPARMLRREFAVDGKLRRATAYICGLGLSELYLNGEKVSDDVLSPALSDYTKRAYYVTYDVTKQLKKGANAVGVILGNGRFYAPRTKAPTGTVGYGYPKLLFQMRLEYEGGATAEVVSDGSWKLTTAGPIRANNEYDGEDYDARMEIPGWDKAGFDDRQWQAAQGVAAPGGQVAAQMIEPIRVTTTLKPITLTEPQPGVWIYDFGQNMVGWCRLKVSGPRGTVVTLRHAETLKPDGTLYLDNIRGAKVTDNYTLKGKGTEIYEPRFTYHGFRFVELTGYPGKPRLSTLEGEVVHDDLSHAGNFASSNPLLNRIYSNILWGVRGNYRSLPTDCPQRDERQGWLGDRSAESKGETYLFNTAALYAKWLQDMADAQRPSGSVSDVCPAYWPIYSDNVTWPSSTVVIPQTLHDQFADRAVVARHYESARKWMDYMRGFVTNGIISRDSYGDWCVPPEEQTLIHSKDPNRKTDKALLATSYFYYDSRLMAGYATALGKTEDARYFNEQAEQLKAAFNARFYKTDKGYYDNGSQTSCVLPLAFGLVPDDQRSRVFAHLVHKITDETHNHIGTGLIGAQYLMRVLTDGGRADLAYTIASQRTYPSWGYMVDKGATTVWELWNGDTADPAMNSGNHVMLVGDLNIWLHENLAGIKCDPQRPGFKHIIMCPQPVGDLQFVQATHRSPYGWIVSDWKKARGQFFWDIVVPVNAVATAFVPASAPDAVTEHGKPASQSPGVKLIQQKDGRAVFELTSGRYHFESR